MKKKVLVVASLASVLAIGLSAHGVQHGNFGNGHFEYKKSKNCKNKHFKRIHGMKKHNHGIMGIIKKLDLTSEQKKQVFQIKKDMMKNQPSLNMAFTKASFDKDKFIYLFEQQRENKLKNKANFIEKVYNILSDGQKERLKEELDLQAKRKIEMAEKCFDKNSHGGR
ncbi:MAG: hypothetical protein CR967_02010 [Proteobacteria bacterium]|nr:MAG: hypothetical protein CR967_02010 [Pseudomonadota bacterium]